MKQNLYGSMIARLNAIYAQIPSMQCNHCHACSSPIFWFYPEECNIREFMKEHNIPYVTWTEEEFKKNGMKCPYLHSNRCQIYPVRPIVCRLQGVIEDLPCKFLPRPTLSSEEVFRIKKELSQLLIDYDAAQKCYGTRKVGEVVSSTDKKPS
jgi:hypothetical protein